MFLDISGKTNLILVLDIHELLLRLQIIRIYGQLLHMRQIHNPVVSDLIRYPCGEQRIAVQKETSLRNSVRLIIELLRPELIEILQLLML